MKSKILLKILMPFFFLLTAFTVVGQISPSTPTLSAFSATYGSVSSEQSFTFTASGLTALGTVTVTAPANFEIATTSGGSFGASVNVAVDGSGDVNPAVTIWVRMASGINAGSVIGGNITLVESATNATVAIPNSMVNTRAITITANNESKVYGNTLTSGAGKTAFTISSGTMASGESITSVTLTYTAGASASAAVGANPSTIVPNIPVGSGGFNVSNYDITFVNGNLTVTALPITITANNESKVYGNTLSSGAGKTAFTISSGTMASGESISSVTLTYGTGGAATDGVGVNTGTVVASAPVGAGGFLASNYDITYVNGNITVTQAALTVTADNISKVYGATLTSGAGKTTFSSSGLQNGETIGSVTLTYGTGASATDAAGVNTGTNVPTAATGGTFNASNYSITYVNGNITVTQAALTVTADNVSKAYGTTLTSGAGKTTFTTSGLQNGETIGSVTLTYGTGGAAGDPVAVNTGTNVPSAATGGTFNTANYSITYVNGNITVTALPITITANNESKVYGTALTSGTGKTAYTLSSGTLISGESITSVTLTYGTGGAATDGVGVNSGTVVASAPVGAGGFLASNYDITYVNGNITVTQAPLTITANSFNKNYGAGPILTQSSSSFTASGLQNGETIGSATFSFGTGHAPSAAVGTYTGSITPSLATGGTFNAANYSITYVSGDLIVVPRALTITADNVSKAYGTTLTSGTGKTTFTANGLQNSETIGSVTLTYGTGGAAGDPVAVNTGTNVPSAATGGTFNAANYSITYVNGNITVTALPITITANNESKVYGTALTSGTGKTTYTLSSGTLVSGESITSVTLTYGTGGAATDGVGVNTGTIVASAPVGAGGFLASNYDITYVNGNITVTQAALTVTADNISKVYGATLTSGTGKTTFTSTGLQNGETIGSVTLTYGTGGAASDPVAVNTGTNVPTAATGGTFNAANYTITYVNGNITVTAAPLTITADNETKIYGTSLINAAGKTTFTSSGLVNGETLTSVSIMYGTGAAPNAPVGTTTGTVIPFAAVGANGFLASNYNITYANGNITVTPAPLTITANAVNKEHGTLLASPATGVTAFTATGLVNWETIGSVTMTYGTGAAILDPIAVNANQVTPSAATGGTFTASNYTITYVPANLNVVVSTNAFLSDLVASTGPLNTAFNKFDLDYDTYVLTAVDQFTITPTLENQFATIQARIDNTGFGPGAYVPLTSGVASAPFSIREGDNIIEILVTAEDGVTQLNYRILYRRESSFVSGGGGGGLESKSLGDAIAQRVLNNAINDMNGAVDYNKLPVVETAQGTIRSTSTNSIFGLQLASIMPDLSSRGYKAYNSSPIDIVSFTNAKEVFAVDYVNTNKETKAVAFTTKTLGELYDHTKPICDRLKGATLLDVESVKIDGYNFINYTIRNDKGNLEYATAFTVGAKAGRNSFNLQSAFLTTSYVNEDQMYNFQIWAASPNIVNDMVKEVLAKLKDVAPVSQSIVSASPDTYIESGKREGANLKLVIKNGTAATTGFFKFEDRSNESSTGIVTRNVPFTVNANGTSTITVPVGDKYESSISMSLNGEVKDNLYMSDGTWAIDYNRNTTSVSAFTVSNDAKRVISANEYPVLRNVEVKANSSDFVSLFKLLKAGGMEADLSGYAGLKFTASGGYNLRVTMVQNGISEWKNQYTTDIRLGSGQQEYFIPFSQFKSAASTKNIDPKDVTTLVFTVEVNAGRNSPIASTFSNISFTKEKPVINTTEQEEKTIQVFPNPVTDNVFTASFVSPVAGELTMKINDGTGRSIFTKQVNVVKGPNAVPVRLNNGVIGTHFLTLEGKGVKFAPTTVVIVK